jgi:hypothetical protein
MIVSRTERIWFRNYDGTSPLVIHRPLVAEEFMSPALRCPEKSRFVMRLPINWLAVAQAA